LRLLENLGDLKKFQEADVQGTVRWQDWFGLTLDATLKEGADPRSNIHQLCILQLPRFWIVQSWQMDTETVQVVLP
jgi:hypothetical protein